MAEVAQVHGRRLWSAYEAGHRTRLQKNGVDVRAAPSKLPSPSTNPPDFWPRRFPPDTRAPGSWAGLTDTNGSVNPTAVSTEEGTVLFL